MHWNSLAEFLAMGGRGTYVWSAFGIVTLVFLLEPLYLLWHHRQQSRKDGQ